MKMYVKRLFTNVGVILTVMALLSVVVLSAVYAQDTEDPIPPEISDFAEWPLANRDYSNTRATTNSPIDSSNINTLGVAWTMPLTAAAAAYGSAATNPVIIDGIVYFQDLESNIYAVNLADGSPIWTANFGVPNIGPNGVAVAYGKVFAPVGPNIVALDINDGTQIWAVNIRTQNESEGITIQPSVYNGMVFVSTVPGSSTTNFYSGGVGGIIYAIDQATGDVFWSFNTVDSDDLWGNPTINSGGGAWYSPAVDTESGMVFFGTGNPAPYPGTEDFPSGTSRPGPNLYTDSMLAIDQTTGELQWYRQMLQHDLFDLDFMISPILTTINYYGEERDVVIGSGKLGRVVAFDRSTGEILWDTPVGMHQNDMLDRLPEGEITVVYPGTYGGVETPMAYADGVLYVPLLNLSTSYEPDKLRADLLDISSGTGELLAIDVNSGRVLWQNEFNSLLLGAATVVNDLVFTADYTGMIYAFNRFTGEQLWSYQAPSGINASPAVAGNTLVWIAGAAENPTVVALRPGAAEASSPETTPENTPVETPEVTLEAPVSTPEVADVSAPVETPEVTTEGTAEATETAPV